MIRNCTTQLRRTIIRCYCTREEQVIMVVGGRRGIGKGFVSKLEEIADEEGVHLDIIATSSTFTSFTSEKKKNANVHSIKIDINDPTSYNDAAQWVTSEFGQLDILINCIGILHGKTEPQGPEHFPEKSYSEIEADWMMENFRVNTVPTAMLAKHFNKLLASGNAEQRPSILATLSARIGSISDNRLGGWYSYRASKAAEHQLVKTLAIEMGRKYKGSKERKVISVCLHPGTVDTKLSEPFQKNIAKDKLFSPTFSAGKLLAVINSLTLKDNGKIFAYDGNEIPC